MKPINSETPEADFQLMFSPKKYPREVIMIAQSAEAVKNIHDVRFVSVLARPATIGMNALTEGMSLPIKIYHMPLFVNVVCSVV